MRFALRSLAQSPGFSLVAILMLALGLGLSTSSFSLTNTFLLRDVPYPDPDQLVRLFATSRQSQRGGHAPGNALDVRDTATSFTGVALYNDDRYAVGDPGSPAEQVEALAVTSNFFTVLRVQPALGRGFATGEDQPDQPAVVVLTHRGWMQRFGGDVTVVGRSLRINTQPYTVIGVLPPEFDAPLVWGPIEFILPRTLQPDFRANRRSNWMQAIARLKPGVSLRQAQAELAMIAARLEQAYPKENQGRGLRVLGLAHANMDEVPRLLIWLMTGISLAMLLIACANLASLQVARAFGRSREFAIRAALGADRRQLMVPLLLESLILAAFGGIGGWFVALWSNDLTGRFLVFDDVRGFTITVDGCVVAFTACAALLSGLAFGLAPAWLASRSTAAEALKEGARSATANPSHQRLKRALIITELALALTLVGLATAFGLGARSFTHRDVGWNMDGLFSGLLALPESRYDGATRIREFHRALIPKLAALPGVEHAALTRRVPIGSLGGTSPVTIEGSPIEDAGQRPLTQFGLVSAGYFAALQIPLKQGTLFSADLTEKDPPVVLVNEAFARRFWPAGDAIGHRVRLADTDPWSEIIGVVADIGLPSQLTPPVTSLQLYRPLGQAPTRYTTIVLRTALAPESLTRAVREAVASLDADLPVGQPGSLRAGYELDLTNLNFVIINLAVSAAMGLLIAAIGLFGVIAQLTAQRTREIGVRIALGARGRDILGSILGEGLRLLLVGVAIGIPPTGPSPSSSSGPCPRCACRAYGCSRSTSPCSPSPPSSPAGSPPAAPPASTPSSPSAPNKHPPLPVLTVRATSRRGPLREQRDQRARAPSSLR